jgi:hypothetical protein
MINELFLLLPFLEPTEVLLLQNINPSWKAKISRSGLVKEYALVRQLLKGQSEYSSLKFSPYLRFPGANNFWSLEVMRTVDRDPIHEQYTERKRERKQSIDASTMSAYWIQQDVPRTTQPNTVRRCLTNDFCRVAPPKTYISMGKVYNRSVKQGGKIVARNSKSTIELKICPYPKQPDFV